MTFLKAFQQVEQCPLLAYNVLCSNCVLIIQIKFSSKLNSSLGIIFVIGYDAMEQFDVNLNSKSKCNLKFCSRYLLVVVCTVYRRKWNIQFVSHNFNIRNELNINFFTVKLNLQALLMFATSKCTNICKIVHICYLLNTKCMTSTLVRDDLILLN